MGEIRIKFMDEYDLLQLSKAGDEAVKRLRDLAARRWWQFWKRK